MKIDLVAVPQPRLEAQSQYDAVWSYTREIFKKNGITQRKCVRYMEDVLRNKKFCIYDWDGEEFSLPEDLFSVFDEDAEFASVGRYLRANPKEPTEPAHRSVFLLRVQLLHLFAQALQAMTEHQSAVPAHSGAPPVHQRSTGHLPECA